jgi:type II secretory pathway component PulF
MELAYRYSAKNARNETVTGLLMARSLDHAYYRAQQLGLSGSRIHLSILDGLGSLVQRNGKQQLALFYRALADRLNGGDDRAAHLVFQDALSFITDVRLRQSIQLAYQALSRNGSSLAESMRLAGFPEQDCAVLAATQKAGREALTLDALAAQLEREAKLDNDLSNSLIGPVLLVCMVIATLVECIFYIFPAFAKLAVKTRVGDNMTQWVATVYEMAEVVAKFPWAVGITSGVLLMLVIWSWKSGALIRLSAIHPTARKLTACNDQIRTWGSWIAMEAAGLAPADSFRMLSDGAKLQATRRMLMTASNLVARGTKPARAIELAGFPTTIVTHAKAAAEGQMAKAMTHMVKALTFEVDVLSAKLAQWYVVLGLFVGSLLVLFVARVTMLEFFIIAMAAMKRSAGGG